MRSEKSQFDPKYHNAETLAKEKPFTVRVSLLSALAAGLEPYQPTRVGRRAAEVLAQRLAFVPEVKSGWGPYPEEVQKVAKNLVDCYMAHLDAFTSAGFPAPDEAALDAVKEFHFAV